MRKNECLESEEKGKGRHEEPDASGKAPLHRAVATKNKLKNLLRFQMKKRAEDDESHKVEDIIAVKTNMQEKDEIVSEEEDDDEDDNIEELDEDNTNDESEK